MSVSQRIKSRALERIRANGRQVSWVPDWMGWGNNAYQWLWAYAGQEAGARTFALLPDKHSSWGTMFPAAREAVLLSKGQVSFTDQRVTPWVGEERESLLDGMGEFINSCMLPGSGIEPSDPDELVVNVRRGDYYSNPTFRSQFGMPVERYLKVAIAKAVEEGGSPSKIHIVSDGVVWCRDHLTWLADIAPVTYEGEGRTPQSDLRRVAGARRLVITNSTFSYWAGYLSDSLYQGDHQVVAPTFFRRDEAEWRSHHLLPTWTVIEQLPEGWQLGHDD